MPAIAEAQATADADQLIEGTGAGTGVPNVDALLWQYHWAGDTLTYSFPLSADDYGDSFPSGDPPILFVPTTAAQQATVEAIFSHISSFTLLSFTEAASPGAGVIRIAQNDESSAANLGILPEEGASGGDVWINSHGRLDVLSPGSGAWYIFSHEIGHALGLLHTHDGSPQHPPTTPDQDSWEFSVMSYRSYVGGGANWGEWIGKHPQSFMMLDIAALQYLYGANFSHNSGDTTYRWNATTGQMSIDGLGQFTPATNVIFMTLWDGGGNDTFDLSNYSNGVVIDLRPGEWTTTSQTQLVDLGTGFFGADPVYARGNIANALLYQGDERSLIENALGGGGNDNLTGNAVANLLRGNGGSDVLVGQGGNDTLAGGAGADMLTGGTGSDSFADLAAHLNGDTITDFSAGDRIVISDATLASFTFSLSGNTLTYSGGSIILQVGITGTLVASAAAEGGVQISFGSAITPDVRNDFNGDGRSDILWRHTDGTIGDWLANPNGSHTSNGASVTPVPNDWSIAGTGDFNGDGRDDILWRSDAGEVGNWLANANGSFSYNAVAGVTIIPLSWQVEGVGDFNADGRDDILWRHTDGTVGVWSGTANGGYVANNAAVFNVSTDWQIAGTGDFNGDGRDDILWRHDSGSFADWLANDSGGFAPNNPSLVAITSDWHIIGTGDFNGDGRDDILWRHDSGTSANWTANADGTFSPNFASLLTITNDWNAVSTGDYNGDGRDDILWRHDSGTIASWTANPDNSGTFTTNQASFAGVPNDWQVQDPAILGI